jgi:trigger factor
MPVKSKEPVGPCEVSLDIEVESTKVAAAVDRAYREFSKYIAVPGFRVGKAPMAFVKQRVPQDQLRERTAELLAGPAYEQAITENNIVPYTRPRMEMVKLETTAPDFVFEFKAIVPLPPAVTLGKYVGLEIDRERIEVTDADVDRRIESLRDRATEYTVIEDRSAAVGDVVEGTLSVTFEDADSEGEFQPIAITIGDTGNVPGVDEALIGVSKGEEKSFELVYPADYPTATAAGKRSQCIVRVKDLHSRIVPDLDDAFAKRHGAETVEELRRNQRTEMEKRRLEMADSAVSSKLVDAVVEGSKIDYPPILLDVELESDIKAFRDDLGLREITTEEYLHRNGITEEELLEQFRTRADVRLRRGLTLGEIARVEKLVLADEDVEGEIQARADAQHTNVQAMRAYIDRAGDMDALRDSAYSKKIIGFIKAAATITDKVVKQEDPVVAADAPKAKKPRKKKEAAAGDAG